MLVCIGYYIIILIVSCSKLRVISNGQVRFVAGKLTLKLKFLKISSLLACRSEERRPCGIVVEDGNTDIEMVKKVECRLSTDDEKL